MSNFGGINVPVWKLLKGKLTLTSPIHESLRFAFAFFTTCLFRRCTRGKFLGWVWMVLVNDERRLLGTGVTGVGRFRWRMMRMMILKKEFPFDFYWSPYSWDTTCSMLTHNDSEIETFHVDTEAEGQARNYQTNGIRFWRVDGYLRSVYVRLV